MHAVLFEEGNVALFRGLRTPYAEVGRGPNPLRPVFIARIREFSQNESNYIPSTKRAVYSTKPESPMRRRWHGTFLSGVTVLFMVPRVPILRTHPSLPTDRAEIEWPEGTPLAHCYNAMWQSVTSHLECRRSSCGRFPEVGAAPPTMHSKGRLH